MIIREQIHTIKELFNGFVDNGDDGVWAFGGCLNVRPSFQREQVYKVPDEIKVIESIIQGYPINVMYWGTTPNNSVFELIDGQQRTMSICDFMSGKFSIKYQGVTHSFTSLPQEVRDSIRNYELHIYICEGTSSEKMDWFKTINVAGKKLNNQEMRNAIYNGPFIESAKRYFSKINCPAKDVRENYIKGNINEQAVLETVLKWASHKENTDIDNYMITHQWESNADNLWDYFMKVMEWTKAIFPEDLLDIDKVDWGILYNKYANEHYIDNYGKIKFHKKLEGDGGYTHEELLTEIEELMGDPDITQKKGIYDYIFSGDETTLSIRAFDANMKKTVYAQQKGFCKHCNEKFDIKDMQADHIIPWSKGGPTTVNNCQMLCAKCNNNKSARTEKPQDMISCVICGKPLKKGTICEFCGTQN